MMRIRWNRGTEEQQAELWQHEDYILGVVEIRRYTCTTMTTHPPIYEHVRTNNYTRYIIHPAPLLGVESIHESMKKINQSHGETQFYVQ